MKKSLFLTTWEARGERCKSLVAAEFTSQNAVVEHLSEDAVVLCEEFIGHVDEILDKASTMPNGDLRYLDGTIMAHEAIAGLIHQGLSGRNPSMRIRDDWIRRWIKERVTTREEAANFPQPFFLLKLAKEQGWTQTNGDELTL